MVKCFRKKALIMAEQYLPDKGQRPRGVEFMSEQGKEVAFIRTLEGIMTVSPGDWVAQGHRGEYWPIKPDIFVETYEEVT